MQLDVLIPTYNRAALLARALESLLAAERPDGLDVRVTVIDNRSDGGPRRGRGSFLPQYRRRRRYPYEGGPGRSCGLNPRIAPTGGQLVGMIDDDEEVDR